MEDIMLAELRGFGCTTCDNQNACFVNYNFGKTCEKGQYWQHRGTAMTREERLEILDRNPNKHFVRVEE